MMATNEPMTDEMLDEIDEMLHDGDDLPHDLAARLADEVDRLRAREQALAAENAAMRPVVEAVADYAKLKRYADLCEWCGAQGESANSHAAECPVTAATTFLAEHPAAGEAAESEGA